MVKTRILEHARINRKLIKEAINKIFGKTLTLRVFTRTLDNFGQLASSSYADTSFMGDLQVHPNIDEKLMESGMIDVGEGVLYISPEALTTRPSPEDVIVDGSAVWEVVSEIEAPTLTGTICHYSYKLRRQVNSGDS